MQITLYGFRKRANSTKRPETTGATRQVVLKDDCSFINPVFVLNYNNNNPTGYNYCYCEDFNSYYNITNWTYDGRLWAAECVRDPMATFRADILSAGCYVLRSASDYNLDIGDSMYPAKTEVHRQSAYYNLNWARSKDSGVYIVGIVGWNGYTNQAGITYYAVDPAGLTSLYNFIFSNTPTDDHGNTMSWSDLSVVRYAESAITNIMDFSKYVVSVMWFPIYPTITNSADIHIAYWNSGINCGYLTNSQYSASYDIPVPKHPSAATRGKYLNVAPYSEYTLYTPCFGAIDIDSTQLVDADNLHIELTCDFITGVAGLRFSSDLSGYIGQYTGQLGVPQILAGAKSTGIAGAVEGGMSIGGAIASGVMSGGLSMGAINAGINSIFSSLAPRAGVSGSQGTSLLFSPVLALEHRYFSPTEEALQKYGRPLCKNEILGNLSGYCVVSDGNILCKATPAEKAEIKSYLEGGFFIE